MNLKYPPEKYKGFDIKFNTNGHRYGEYFNIHKDGEKLSTGLISIKAAKNVIDTYSRATKHNANDNTKNQTIIAI